MIAQIQVRRGTTAEWATASPVVLAAGEFGYDITLKRTKIGDGTTEWASLEWIDYGTNPNLLHNWDFRNPVNQRGVWGAISTAGYFLDRWVLVSGSVDLDKNVLDKTNVQTDTMIASDGTIEAANINYMSDLSLTLIPVKPGDSIRFVRSSSTASAPAFRYKWLTNNEEYISRNASEALDSIDTAPENAAFLQVSYVRNANSAVYNISAEKTFIMATGTVVEQRIEGNLLAGKQVTVSALLSDGTIKSGTGTMPTAAGAVGVTVSGWGTITLGYGTGYMYVRFTASGVQNVVAVKCELGTVSTLAYDPPMDFGAELAKCQRFFFSGNSATPGFGYSIPSGAGRFAINLPTPMRITPTIVNPITVTFYAGASFPLVVVSTHTLFGSILRFDTAAGTVTASSSLGGHVVVTGDLPLLLSADL